MKALEMIKKDRKEMFNVMMRASLINAGVTQAQLMKKGKKKNE